MITLLLAAALLMPQVAANPCPAEVANMWIKGGRSYGYENHIELALRNKSDKTIESVEFQFERYDSERRVSEPRYYLSVGCCDKAGFKGKPVGPNQTKWLWGRISSTLGFIYGGLLTTGNDIKINVIHYTDGSKWERPNWRDERPN